jgi:hypothetical protein
MADRVGEGGQSADCVFRLISPINTAGIGELIFMPPNLKTSVYFISANRVSTSNPVTGSLRIELSGSDFLSAR